MIKKEYYSFNEIAIISMIIIILRNIYIYFNLNIFLIIGSFLDYIYSNLYIYQYIEIFYAILLIVYNILLVISKKYFNLIVKYKLRKYFVLTNLIILFFYIFKEPLFFYSSKKTILVLSFLLIEIRIKIKNWKEIIEEIFGIVLISAFVYFFQYITAVLVYIMGLFLFFF